MKPKFSSTFIFETKNPTEEFHALDQEIAERARAIPGFLGEEAWCNDQTGLHAEVYYWSSMQALRTLIEMDTHQNAKDRHKNWLGRYRVIISEVQATYGSADLGLEHIPAHTSRQE